MNSVYYKINTIFICILSLAVIVFTACQKEKYTVKPSLSFVKDSGYVYKDSSLRVGQQIKTGIFAKANGEGNQIIRLLIQSNEQVIIDTLLKVNPLSLDFYIKKNSDTLNIWKFTVFDKAYLENSIKIKTPLFKN